MQTPTRLQTLLLNGIQNLTRDNWTRITKSGAGRLGKPRAEADEQISMNDRTVTQLEDLALLVGCPSSWLNYARRAGERGQPSDPARSFYSPDEVPRPMLIAALARQIHELQDSAGILAIHALHRPGLDGDDYAKFRAVMGVVWQRLGGVSHELGVTDRERDRMWSRHGSRHWANIVAREATGYNDQQLAARFHTIARADFSMAAAPLVVILQAGINLDDIKKQMPDSPDRMVELVGVALDAIPRDPEALAVNDAVAAATLSQDTTTEHVRDESAWSDTGFAAPQVADLGHEP